MFESLVAGERPTPHLKTEKVKSVEMDQAELSHYPWSLWSVVMS